jgi:Zn-dependent protease
LFGWAKPVPVDFTRLRDKRYGPAIVAAAGPFSNFILAIVSALLFHLLAMFEFNEFISTKVLQPVLMMLVFSVQINVALGIFNLVPILPLDGGRILQTFLPLNLAYKYSQTERYGFLIIIILLITNVIGKIVFPIIYTVVNILI